MIKTLALLWNYLNVYFLKPFDAVNDTLTANLLLSFKWPKNYTEIGSGDGVFSYIMHGGSFSIFYDRYLDIDLNKKDIFDVHNKKKLFKTKSTPNIKLDIAIDAKPNHIKKIIDIGFAFDAVLSKYENLPYEDNSINNIFLYTPHGFSNYQKSIKEAVRVLKSEGHIFILVFNSEFKSSFISYRLANYFKGFLKSYFKKIDNGRFLEITQMSRTLSEWEYLFKSLGLEIFSFQHGLSFFAWKIYDIQTRPILSQLIKVFNFFPIFLRTIIKFIWMCTWFPVIVIFYLFFSRSIKGLNKECYYSFDLVKK